MKTLILRRDEHLPCSYSIVSPTGKTVAIGKNRETGEPNMVLVRYKFRAGMPLQVYDDDYDVLRNYMWKNKSKEQVHPMFGGQTDIDKGLTPKQQIEKLTEKLNSVVAQLAESGVVEFEMEEDEGPTQDDGVVICQGCGNVYPPGFKGVCYRCKTEVA